MKLPLCIYCGYEVVLMIDSHGATFHDCHPSCYAAWCQGYNQALTECTTLAEQEADLCWPDGCNGYELAEMFLAKQKGPEPAT